MKRVPYLDIAIIDIGIAMHKQGGGGSTQTIDWDFL